VSPRHRMSHKFHIGQIVEFRPKKGSPISAARGAYEILKQLPEQDGELQYRIKSAREEHERIALESELEYPESELSDTPAFEAALADLFLGPDEGLGVFVPGADEGIHMLL